MVNNCSARRRDSHANLDGDETGVPVTAMYARSAIGPRRRSALCPEDGRAPFVVARVGSGPKQGIPSSLKEQTRESSCPVFSLLPGWGERSPGGGGRSGRIFDSVVAAPAARRPPGADCRRL